MTNAEATIERTRAERLRETREDVGMTQEEWAEAILVDRTTVSRYENGKAFPKGRILREISKVSGRSIPWLRASKTEVASGPDDRTD